MTAQPSQPAGVSQPSGNRRRRRRWLWVVVAILALVLLAVVLAPYLVSSSPGEAIIVSAVDSKLAGNVVVDDISLNWFGPSRLRGIHIYDPSSRQVLEIQSVTYAGGLWRLMTSPTDFKSVEVRSPHVVLYVDAQGRASLMQAFESPSQTTQRQAPAKAPAGQRKTSSPPSVFGTLTLLDGQVEVIRSDGRTLAMGLTRAVAEFDTLNDISADAQLSLPGGQQATAKFAMRDLVHTGKIDLALASGAMEMATSQPGDLEPIVRFASSAQKISGQGSFKINATMAQGRLQASVSAELRQLAASGTESVTLNPIDLRLDAKLQSTPEQFSAEAHIAGPGEVRLALDYPQGQKIDVSMDKVVAAAANGQDVTFPDFTLRANGALDLAAIANAVPALLEYAKDAQLASGKLRIDNVTVRGGQTPSAIAQVGVTDLTVGRQGQARALEPVTLAFDAQVQPNVGLVVRRGKLDAPFATATFTGAPREKLAGGFAVDLPATRQYLGQLLAKDLPVMTGRVSGTLSIARSQDAQRLDATVNMAMDDVTYQSQAKAQPLSGLLYAAGYVRLAQGKLAETGVTQSKLEVPGEFLATGAGRYDFTSKALALEVDVPQADLGALSERLAAVGMGQMQDYDGQARMASQATRTGAGAWAVSGTAQFTDLRALGRPITDSPTLMLSYDLQAVGTGTQMLVQRAALRSPIANVSVADLRVVSGTSAQMSGMISGSASIAPLLTLMAPVAGWEQPPQLAGLMAFGADVQTQQQTISAKGNVVVPELIIGGMSSGTQATRPIRQQNMRLDFGVLVDQGKELISITQAKLVSQPVTASVQGQVTEYRTRKMLDLQVQYDGAWDEIEPLLHELAPQTRQNVTLAGRSASTFKVIGPAHDPKAVPAFRGVSAEPALQWESASLYGLNLGKANLTPQLGDGQFVLPPQDIAANGGTLRLEGTVDMRTPEPTLRMPGKVQVLRDVGINEQLAQQLLGRLNVVLGTAQEGKVSMAVQDLDLPMSDAIKQRGTGSGHVDLSSLRLQPKGVTLELLQLLGGSTQGDQIVQPQGLDFTIDNGKIRYQNFVIVFGGGVDLIFSGSVAMGTGDLDMVVSVPVVPGVLQKFGVSSQYAQALQGMRIDVPLKGTRQFPQLDFSRVDVRPLVQQATGQLLRQQVGDILAPPGGEPSGTTTQPATSPAKQEQSPAENLLDIIRRQREKEKSR